MQMLRIKTRHLEIAYNESGTAHGRPVILLHGFPYDPRAFDEVPAILAQAGFWVLVPYLRGFGGTRFLAANAIRSGEQAALGHDLLEFMDALGIKAALLAGFDWGGRAACVVAALWPERCDGLVSCAGYAIQDIRNSVKPAPPRQESRLWYQYYFHLERGRFALAENRHDLCHFLWQQWSPTWRFTDEIFAQSATSFNNSDFVDVVIHSYRHRTGSAAGDPVYVSLEAKLAQTPVISVPTICLHGADDGVIPASSSKDHARLFSGQYERRVLVGVGHNPPQEAPREFADAVLALHS